MAPSIGPIRLTAAARSIPIRQNGGCRSSSRSRTKASSPRRGRDRSPIAASSAIGPKRSVPRTRTSSEATPWCPRQREPISDRRHGDSLEQRCCMGRPLNFIPIVLIIVWAILFYYPDIAGEETPYSILLLVIPVVLLVWAFLAVRGSKQRGEYPFSNFEPLLARHWVFLWPLGWAAYMSGIILLFLNLSSRNFSSWIMFAVATVLIVIGAGLVVYRTVVHIIRRIQ